MMKIEKLLSKFKATGDFYPWLMISLRRKNYWEQDCNWPFD